MKISELAQTTAINAEDVFPVVQDGETKKVPANVLLRKQRTDLTITEDGKIQLMADDEPIGNGAELPKVTIDNEITEDGKNPVSSEAVIKYVEEKSTVTDSKLSVTSENPVQNKIVSQSVANALKGSANGENIALNDISPIEHKVSVWVHGKNLFNGEVISGLFADKEFTTAGSSPVFKSIKIFLKAGTYIISFDKPVNIVRTVIDGVWSIVGSGYVNITTGIFEVKSDGYIGCSFRDATSSNTEWDDAAPIQIECGETATKYTPYVDPSTVTVTEEITGATYTPNADGICEVTSVSPTMTLSTNTAGVTIQCDYNKDTNAVLGDIETALDSIIEMQMSYIGGAEQ